VSTITPADIMTSRTTRSKTREDQRDAADDRSPSTNASAAGADQTPSIYTLDELNVHLRRECPYAFLALPPTERFEFSSNSGSLIVPTTAGPKTVCKTQLLVGRCVENETTYGPVYIGLSRNESQWLVLFGNKNFAGVGALRSIELQPPFRKICGGPRIKDCKDLGNLLIFLHYVFLVTGRIEKVQSYPSFMGELVQACRSIAQEEDASPQLQEQHEKSCNQNAERAERTADIHSELSITSETTPVRPSVPPIQQESAATLRKRPIIEDVEDYEPNERKHSLKSHSTDLANILPAPRRKKQKPDDLVSAKLISALSAIRSLTHSDHRTLRTAQESQRAGRYLA